MSLILEALKKSEAERRLGRAPGLLDSVPASRMPRAWKAWHGVLGIAVLAAVAALAYLGGQRGAELLAPMPAAVTTPLPSSAEEQRPQLEVAPPQASAAQRGAESIAPAPAPAANSDPSFASIERESTPRPVQALPAPSPPAEAAPKPAPPSETGATAAVAAQPEPPPSAEPPTTTMTAEASIPSINSLGPEARGRLPPLKTSMHVYAQAPADRVLILDGRRLREGDQIDSRLRLLEIRSDGSVLELDGRRLLLPRP